jgi:hypothetical protein
VEEQVLEPMQAHFPPLEPKVLLELPAAQKLKEPLPKLAIRVHREPLGLRVPEGQALQG